MRGDAGDFHTFRNAHRYNLSLTLLIIECTYPVASRTKQTFSVVKKTLLLLCGTSMTYSLWRLFIGTSSTLWVIKIDAITIPEQTVIKKRLQIFPRKIYFYDHESPNSCEVISLANTRTLLSHVRRRILDFERSRSQRHNSEFFLGKWNS